MGKEKKLLQKYFDHIAQDTGCFCFMVDDTLKGLEMGAVEDLIIWDNLEIQRYLVRNIQTQEEKVLHLNKEQETQDKYFRDEKTGVELETIDKMPLVEWFAENYKAFGCNLEFITDRSAEGTQFVKGFGGIGGTLRWKVDLAELNSYEDAANLDAKADGNSDSDDDSDSEYEFDDGDFGF